ncbi:DUF4082 domain-containing protein [Cohnella sp.]|uniref:DUF4082 domain-containing protein n=1 Tax=Cohnella sp. TaxID=1883426 RepID=UPI0037037CC3
MRRKTGLARKFNLFIAAFLVVVMMITGNASPQQTAYAEPSSDVTDSVDNGASMDDATISEESVPAHSSTFIPWPVTATIGKEDGGAVLKVNGEIVNPVFMYGNTMKQFPNYSAFLDTIDKVKTRDVHGYMWVNVLKDNVWNAQVNDDIFTRDPNAYGIIRVGLQDEMSFDAGEYSVTEKGNRPGWPSVASKAWRSELDSTISNYLEWLSRQPYANRIIGFQIMGMETGEWFYNSNDLSVGNGEDYSAPMVAAFRQWLTDKYGSDATLRAAWNNSGVTLATASIPTAAERDYTAENYFRSMATEGKTIDYQTFYSEEVAGMINYAAGLFKQKTDSRVLVGAMYGYPYMFATYVRPSNHGHQALRKILESDSVDFIGSPVQYNDRRMGLSAEPMGAFDSLALNGKMLIVENDTRTHVIDSTPYTDDQTYRPRVFSLQETLDATRRETANEIITGGGQYWMDLFSHGWWNDEDIWDENQKLIALQASKYLISADRTFRPDVAVILDEESYSYHTLITNYNTPTNNPYAPAGQPDSGFGHLLARQQRELAKSGVKYGYYLMSDIDKIPSSVKTYIFLNAYRVTNAQKASIDSLKKDDNVLVFIRAPGYFNDTGSDVTNISNLIGMTMSKATHTSPATQIFDSSDPATLGSGVSVYGGWKIGGDTGEVEPVYSYTPSFYVTDSQAEAIGHYDTDPGKISFARKDFGNWTSIFSASGSLPAGLIRSIAVNVGGAHSYYNEGNDNVRTDGKIIMMHASVGNSGIKTIYLPRPSRVVDLIANRTVATGATSFSFYLGETRTALYNILPNDSLIEEVEGGTVTKSGAWSDDVKYGYSDGKAVISNQAGDSVTYAFSGTDLSLKASTGPNRGRANVAIDGIEYPYIEMYSPNLEYNKEFVIAQGLPSGPHTIEITVDDNKHRNSSGTSIALDAFVVGETIAGSGSTPAPIPVQQSIFTTQTPLAYGSDTQYELGTKFKSTVDGSIMKARLYSGANEGGIHTVSIWRANDGVRLSGPHNWIITPGNSEWKEFELPTPLKIKANTDYIVSVTNSSTDKIYAVSNDGFSVPISNRNLVTYSGSGVYSGTLGSMPSATSLNRNYFRDIVFVPNNSEQIFTSQVPETFSHDAQYELGTKFKTKIKGYITKAKVFTSEGEGGNHSVSLWRASDGTRVAGPYTWNIASGTSGWKEYELPSPVSVDPGVDYIVSVTNSSTDKQYAVSDNGLISPIQNGHLVTYVSSGVYSAALGSMPTNTNLNRNYFRDVVFVPAHGESVLSTQVPSGYGADQQYELGTKFKTTVNGHVSRVRLYTYEYEGGNHTVRIWKASDGTLLTGPYLWNVTAGVRGWREFILPTALSVAANEDYIVSITNSSTDKVYAFAENGYGSPIVNGHLVTYAGSGVYSGTLGTMPTATYGQRNYFRDVVFIPD